MTSVAVRPRREALPRLRYVGKVEGRKMLDRQAKKLLGISGDEFLRRWDAGEYAEQMEDLDCPTIQRLSRLISFAR